MYLPITELPKPIQETIDHAGIKAVCFKPAWTETLFKWPVPYAVILDENGKTLEARPILTATGKRTQLTGRWAIVELNQRQDIGCIIPGLHETTQGK